MGAEAWVAIYAAIVATGALALEVRRWFESGPKIVLSARANMVLIDGYGTKTDGLLVVNAVNRGSAPTTIETLAVLEFGNPWERKRLRPKQSFIIPNPSPAGAAGQLPFVIQPGEKWTGMAAKRTDITGDIQTGSFWAAVYTTDRDRPYLAKIPKPHIKRELKDAASI